MNNLLPGVPVKKGLLYFLIIGIFSNNLQAHSFFKSKNINKNMTYVMAAGMGISAAWAIYEKISKRTLQSKTNKLEEEVNSFKSDENIKEHLVKIANLDTKWSSFLNETDIYHDGPVGNVSFDDHLISHMFLQMKQHNLNPDNFHQQLTKAIGDFNNYSNDLAIKVKSYKNKKDIKTSIEKISNKLDETHRFLKLYNQCFENHKAYIQLSFFLDLGIETEYAQEIDYAYSEIANWGQTIDQIIRSKSSQTLFPYLFYTQDLQSQLTQLSKYLNNLSNFKAHSFQEQKIARAQYVHDALEVILQFASTSETLVKEKDAKVEYDRKEKYIKTEIAERIELLRLETKERESKIQQQNSFAEAKLIDQRNKEKQLANEKARIEKEKKEAELKNQESLLQIARIHEGYGITKAIQENDKKWRNDYDDLSSKHQKIIHENQQRDSELKNLRIKLSSLESDMKSLQTNRVEWEHYGKNLQLRISNLARALDVLNSKVGNPPFNPQSVYGLSEYINSLQQQIQELKTLVA